MRVQAKARQGDRIVGLALTLTVLLGHDIGPLEAPGLANINHGREATAGRELVFTKSIGGGLRADLQRDAGVIRERPKVAANIELVGLLDFLPRCVVGFGVGPVGADIIGPDRVHGVPVGFAVG